MRTCGHSPAHRLLHAMVFGMAVSGFMLSGSGLAQTTPQPGAQAASQPAEPKAALPDEVPRGATVMDRPRPDYDAAGVRLGSFLLYPGLAVQESYNSNIYATQNNRQDDFITTIAPSIDLRSNWNNHALRMHADTALARYADHQSEDYTDYTLLTDGRVDVLRDLRLFGGAGLARRHEARSSPDNQGGTEPTEYTVYSANAAIEKVFNRMSVRLDGKGERYVFSNVQNSSGGTIDQSGRDRNQGEVSLRTGYELAPLRVVYLQGSVNSREYDNTRDAGGYARSSDGYAFVAGAEYDLTGITSLDIFAGYRQQDYDDARLKNMAGWMAGATLTWNITRLTTVTAGLTRDIEETTLAGASGYFATRTELRVDHELLRNLLLNARVGYEQDDFEGIGREDDYVSAGLGAKYLISRNFALSGGYGYRQRDSSATNSDFSENVVFLRLGTHL
jgi:hypothetical protein